LTKIDSSDNYNKGFLFIKKASRFPQKY